MKAKCQDLLRSSCSLSKCWKFIFGLGLFLCVILWDPAIVSADDAGYAVINKWTGGSAPTASQVVSSGTKILQATNSSGFSAYAIVNGDYNVVGCFSKGWTTLNGASAYAPIFLSDSRCQVYVALKPSYSMSETLTLSNTYLEPNTQETFYFNYCHQSGLWQNNSYTDWIKIPYYEDWGTARSVLISHFNPPHEPEYNQDIDTLGYLKNVKWKQSVNGSSSDAIKGQLDITYDNLTTTGVDLSQTGYGVVTQVIENHINSSSGRGVTKVSPGFFQTIGNVYVGIWDSLLQMGRKTINILAGQEVVPLSTTDEEDRGALTTYDIILRPYYYNGTDYTYGGAFVIKNVATDKVGTRMLKDYKDDGYGNPVSLNQTKTYYTDYNFIIDNSESTEITNNYNTFNETTYYSYTVENNDNSTTNIDNSTTNIYNYESEDGGGWGDLDYQFNPTQTKEDLKGLLGLLVLFVPHVKNLFAYVPEWALNTFTTVFSLIAAIGVIKLLGPLLVNLVGGAVGGGGSI